MRATQCGTHAGHTLQDACKRVNVFDLTVSPHEVFLFPDGFISFEPTVGPKRSVTVKAKYFYGRAKIYIPKVAQNI
jgi:hypothetical protein